MEYTISNHRHYKDFTIIPNVILQSQDLSFAEKGLLTYLLSLPYDWDIKVSYIASQFGETERAILRWLKGLIEAGYCKRIPRKENGKMAGQYYVVTDIANDFSAPTKNEGAGNANVRPTETSAPRENGGADNKEYSLFKKEDIDIKKEDIKLRGTSDKVECLFINSRFYDFDAFKAEIQKDEKYAGADLEFYYERIKNWSAQKSRKKKDWIAFTKNWMLSDFQDGKLQLAKKNSSISQDEIENLQILASL